MKSVGIITYHHYYNYGTMLQAYALQKKIEMLGYESEIIDFKQDNSFTAFQLAGIRIKRIPVYLKEHKKYSVLSAAKKEFFMRNAEYEEFYKKYLKVGKREYTDSTQLIDEPPKYDGFIVGSDQTWNPYVANNPEAFYLTFVDDDRKKGSYAPSLGVRYLSEDQRMVLRSRLSGFTFLSCRESVGAELLSEIINRPVEHVLDPTLLLNKDEWDSVRKKEKKEEPYILTYFLGDIKEHRIFVHKLSKKMNMKVLSIPVSYLDISDPQFEKVWVGPNEFLSLIRNAEIVCTDSFHGTMFSINFEVDFYSFCKTSDAMRTSENMRLYSAFEMFGLSDRLVIEENQEKILLNLRHIDYQRVSSILAKERKRSTDYLETMLAYITE